jgi:asparagine synthase (glutamine-hydrolysing)
MLFGAVNLTENPWVNQKIILKNFPLFSWSNSLLVNPYQNFISCVSLNTEISFIKRYKNLIIDDINDRFFLIEGVIYNAQEVYCELGLNTKLDQLELIKQAFLKWGPAFAEKLNGDFSIIIYLKKQKEIFLYRDHIGLHPLAFSHIGSDLFFSSDPLGFCKALYPKENIDPDFFFNSFIWSSKNHDILPNKKVKTVKPGHYVKITPQGWEEKKYWFPEKIKKNHNLTQKKVTEDLSALISDAVKIRSEMGFIASAHVSGGLDSGIVAALARKEFKAQETFYGFSWTPRKIPENVLVDYDERNLVKEFCQKNNIIPVFPEYSLDDYLSFVSNWRHPSEQLYEKQVVDLAKSKGVNLIFSGWGGDEFISIGHRGIDADLIREGNWGYFLKKHPLWRPKQFLSALFNALFPGARRGYSKIKAEPSVYPYIKKALGSNRIPRKERFKYHSRRLVHMQLLELGHLAKRASDWYVKGQLNGIEYRYPLLDKRIVEYMLKVPSRCLVGGNHYRILLREIGKDIFTPEMLENKSKDDPVKSHYFSEIIKKVEQDFINEFETFRNNPDLSFVDFDLLEKNLPKIRAGKMDASIFYYLKAAHEFTKGYYGKD